MTKKDLNSCFDRMTPDPAQKQKMLGEIISGQKEELKPLKRPVKHLYLLAALVALAVLTMTTALAISFGWHEKLIEYLNPSDEQMTALDGAADTPDATITKNGVTITVKQTLADSLGIYVIYEMTVPDDIELTDDIRWAQYILDIPLAQADESHTLGTTSATVLEQSAHKRTVLIYSQRTAPSENGSIRLQFKDLIDYSNTGVTNNVLAAMSAPLIEDDWALEWDFSYVDTSKTIEVNKPLSINGSEDTITRVVVSPMSACVFVKGDDILGSARPVINFKDYSQITYEDIGLKNKSFMYYLADEDNMVYVNQLYYRFLNIINVEDVVSITVGDVTIPID